MSDYQEGYCDGIAGAGMQDRPGPRFAPDNSPSYFAGFRLGSLDRKPLVAAHEGAMSEFEANYRAAHLEGYCDGVHPWAPPQNRLDAGYMDGFEMDKD